MRESVTATKAPGSLRNALPLALTLTHLSVHKVTKGGKLGLTFFPPESSACKLVLATTTDRSLPVPTENPLLQGLTPNPRALSSGSYFVDCNGVAMVTRFAVHSGSLNLDTKPSGKQNKVQIEVQATKLASMTSCWCRMRNSDLAEGR